MDNILGRLIVDGKPIDIILRDNGAVLYGFSTDIWHVEHKPGHVEFTSLPATAVLAEPTEKEPA